MFKNKKIYVIPIIGFCLIIFMTSGLLNLSICNKQNIPYIDTLYEAASAVSATGCTIVDLSKQYTFWGQLILFVAMEVGAIGFMLFFSLLFMLRKKKVKLSDAIFLGNEVNTNNYTIVKNKVRQITRYTIVIEFLGAWLLAFRFIPMYGVLDGLWYSIFHSASAFCNVGLDILGNNSLKLFANDTYINIVFIVLMFLGSLGFFVIEDMVECFVYGRKKRFHTESKLILIVSLILIIGGSVAIKIFNPELTILQSVFSVVTARNTGFYTVDMSSLSEMNQFFLTLIMFIGGGPGSNAGGIRVVVFSILILATIADVRSQDEIVVFYRSISDKLVKKAISILTIDLSIVLIGMMAFYLSEGKSLLDTLFYIVSAFSNTGLENYDITNMTIAGKWISIVIMYLGRIAPITLVSFLIPTNKKKNGIKYPPIDVVL